MRLETERLIIREQEPDDAPAIYDYSTDIATTKYMRWTPPSSIDETREFLRKRMYQATAIPRTEYDLAITLKSTGEVIGVIGFVITDSVTNEAGMGWLLNKRFWHSGYAVEAAREMMKYAFDGMGMHRISSTCDTANEGSLRVMEKLGMRLEGTFLKKRWFHFENCWHDECEYAILREDWNELGRKKTEIYD